MGVLRDMTHDRIYEAQVAVNQEGIEPTLSKAGLTTEDAYRAADAGMLVYGGPESSMSKTSVAQLMFLGGVLVGLKRAELDELDREGT